MLKIVEVRMNEEKLKQKIPAKYWYLLEDEDFCADLKFLLNKKPSRMAIFCYLDNWDYFKNNL